MHVCDLKRDRRCEKGAYQQEKREKYRAVYGLETITVLDTLERNYGDYMPIKKISKNRGWR